MSAVDLRKVLESIRELNMSGRDENGHRWANSDLIEQEAHAGLVALAEAAISPVSAGKVKAIAEAAIRDCDPEAKDWFWAGTSANDYFGGPISELNHWLPELWQPMPEPSAPPAALPLGEETR